MKLNKTQKELLAKLEESKEVLKEASKEYWENIKIPSCCVALPMIYTIGPKETKEAESLVASGLLVQVANNIFIESWKP
jgi:hypothetical protein